jgi:hypothetical protein
MVYLTVLSTFHIIHPEYRTMNWMGLRYHDGICLVGLRKTIKNSRQITDMTPVPPEYEVTVQPTACPHSALLSVVRGER